MRNSPAHDTKLGIAGSVVVAVLLDKFVEDPTRGGEDDEEEKVQVDASAFMAGLMGDEEEVKAAPVKFDRRRYADDSDSDIDLDGL